MAKKGRKKKSTLKKKQISKETVNTLLIKEIPYFRSLIQIIGLVLMCGFIIFAVGIPMVFLSKWDGQLWSTAKKSNDSISGGTKIQKTPHVENNGGKEVESMRWQAKPLKCLISI